MAVQSAASFAPVCLAGQGLTSAEVLALLCCGPVTARLVVGFLWELLSADPGA